MSARLSGGSIYCCRIRSSACTAVPYARAVPLPAATRKELREFYAGFNEELAHFMDDDPRFLWHER